MIESEAAFLRFVRPCWRRLHLVARHYAASADDARDLVQETLLRAWAGYSHSEDRSYREGWLFVIQRRVAAEWARQANRRIRLVPVEHDELTDLVATELTEPFAALPSMTENQFRELLDRRLAIAFDSLDPSHREVILLSVAGELGYREIAEVLACPLGTVMSRMARARRQLREKLATGMRSTGFTGGAVQEPHGGEAR